MKLRDEETGQLYEARETGVQMDGVSLVALNVISEEIAELEAEYQRLQSQCYEVAKKLNRLRGE